MKIPAYEIFRELERIHPTKPFLIESLFFDDGDIQLLAAHYFTENNKPRTLLYLKRYDISDNIDIKQFLNKNKIMEDYVPIRGIEGLSEDVLNYEPDRMEEVIIHHMKVNIFFKRIKTARLLFNKLIKHINNKKYKKIRKLTKKEGRESYISRSKAEDIVSKWEKVK